MKKYVDHRVIPIFVGALTAIACDTSSTDLGLDDAEIVDSGADADADADVDADADDEETRILEEGSKYMREKAMANGSNGLIPVDFADDRQYEFVKHRLAAAGVNSLTSPGVMARVESARSLALSDSGYRSSGEERCTNVISTPNLTQDSYQSKVNATCFNGSQYIFVDNYLYNEVAELQGMSYDEDWNGVITEINSEIVPPSDSGVWSDSLIYAVPGGGTDEMYYRSTITYHQHFFGEVAMSHSGDANGADGLGAQRTPQAANTFHPIDNGVNGNVLVCLDRSGNDPNCDYTHSLSAASGCSGDVMCAPDSLNVLDVYPLPYDPDKIYMPIGFNETSFIPFNVNSAVVSATANLLLTAPGNYSGSGGDCEAEFTDAEFTGAGGAVTTNYVTVSNNGMGRTLVNIDAFALGLGEGLWQINCIDHRSDAHLLVNVDFSNGMMNGTVSWDSEIDAAFNLLQVAWGCLLPETSITMADGTEKAIEEVQIGESVLSDDGRTMIVKDVKTGVESRPVIEVTDEAGHVVVMTDTHPVPTSNRGILQARDLQEGDVVMTDEGASTLTSVARIDYDGEVYNLELGSAEGSTESPMPGTTTMYADGVLVGDAQMQSDAKLAHDRLVEEQRASAPVPKDLRIDYVMSQGRKALKRLGIRG